MNDPDICRHTGAALRREPELLLHRQEAGLNDSIVSPDGGDAGRAVRGGPRGTRVRDRHDSDVVRPHAAAAARPRARSSTTSTPTASATPASPGSPAGASGRTTTTTASATAASPTTTPTSRPLHDHGHQADRAARAPPARTTAAPRTTACASSAPAAAPTAGPARTRTPRPPAASPPARAATSAAAGVRSTRAYPHKTGKDFGNYKKPKITVIKKLVPASDAGRFDLKVDGTTVKAAAGDGGTGTTSSSPGAHGQRVGCGRHEPRRLHASTECKKTRHDGPGWVHRQSGDEVVCTITNTARARSRSSRSPSPHETGGSAFAFSGFAGGFNLGARRHQDRHRACSRAPSRTGHGVGRPGLPPDVDHLQGRRQHRRGRHAHREHPGRARRDRALHVRQHEATAGIEVVKSRPRARPPRRQDGLHFAVANTGNSPLHDIKVTDDRCSPVRPRR